LSETIKSRILWIGITALVIAIVTDIYNFTKMSITSQSFPIFIPIVFAIIGFGLIIYFFWKNNPNMKKRELQEFDDASDIKDPQRKNKRDWKHFPSN
jgi:hypothetical protein